jgi:hypothetical protein
MISIKSSQVSSCVNSLKCSDVSRTNAILIFRVVGGKCTTYNPEDENGVGP